MNSKPTTFEFTSYSFEPEKKRAVFHYKTEFEDQEPLVWTETIILPKEPSQDIPKETLEKLLESLHMILGISYWKFHCAPNIKISYPLNKQEANFWNTVYKKGLGEFFYQNKLNPNISPKFPFGKSVKTIHYSLPTKNSRVLVGIGGGKDSIVAAELLKENSFDITAFVSENAQSPIISNVIKLINIPDLKIQRILDEKVHQKHLYNGHIPISAIYAFLGIFSCILYDYKYFIVGNEYSSNFGNITYKGLEINHQWSKSFEFEKLFQEYVKNSISPSVGYFSLLRPFYEIRIVKMFSKMEKYFLHFSSCNRNFSIKKDQSGGLWCGECPKCIFAFTLLSAFLSKQKLINIFGKNLYQQEHLLPLFKDILGLGTMKPFDCVGTFGESQSALYLAKKKFSGDLIMRQLGSKVAYSSEVFKTNKNALIPEEFKFLGMENALILGFGKEGIVTKQYLKKEYPKLKIGIADTKEGSDYLKKQQDFDVAIKTPGIKKELVTIPCTTATNIFFSKIKGNYTIIGVTGSKGKSTTSTLIAQILKDAGKPVEFLGNIGKPMLQALTKPINPNTIFVLELSSYQLDDIKFSPDIAVVTNLFPEHLDYHGSLKNYFEAKKNIINFQTQDNYFVYNPQNTATKKWLNGYKGNAIPFSKDIFESNLLGKHNESNIQAAAAVARILNITEESIKQTIKNFEGLPHRLEFVGEYKGIKFYDDAISTTPDSTIMAIKTLPDIGIIFLGGQDRGYNFIQLEKTIKQYKIKNIVLFPDSGSKIIKNTKGLNILQTKSMKEAVVFAYKHTQPGQICLLSCASPSYSLWKNFEEKGDQFKKAVKNLARKS